MTDLVIDSLRIRTDVDVDLGPMARPADLQSGLRCYLEGLTRLAETQPQLSLPGYRYRVYEELVLDLGQPWTAATLPRKLRRGPMRHCYGNTLALVQRFPGLRYVEGFAIPWADGHVGRPELHCWAVNVNGRVWDATWPEPEHSAYFGVVFSREHVERFVNLDADTFGILATEHLIGSPLLRTGRLFPTGARR